MPPTVSRIPLSRYLHLPFPLAAAAACLRKTLCRHSCRTSVIPDVVCHLRLTYDGAQPGKKKLVYRRAYLGGTPARGQCAASGHALGGRDSLPSPSATLLPTLARWVDMRAPAPHLREGERAVPAGNIWWACLAGRSPASGRGTLAGLATILKAFSI